MFKRIKKFYRNNRIYCILMLISITCILVMTTCVGIYFYKQLTTSSYGNRLENISEHKLDDTLNNLTTFLKEQEGILEANVRLQGKIIYVNALANTDMKNEQIQNIATSSLEKISEENKNFYDMQFVFKRDNQMAYFGSKNAGNTIISWANYNVDIDESTTTAKK